jgi:hypothetical protein
VGPVHGDLTWAPQPDLARNEFGLRPYNEKRRSHRRGASDAGDVSADDRLPTKLDQRWNQNVKICSGRFSAGLGAAVS